MHHVPPLFNFATLVDMLIVNLYRFHLHLRVAILYFFVLNSIKVTHFRTGYNYLRATSTKTTAINRHGVPSVFMVQSLLSVLTDATQLLTE